MRLTRHAADPQSGLPVLLIRSELAGASSGVLAHLAERENLAKAIRRVKLPERYQKTLTGDKFVLYDSANDELALDIQLEADERVLVFTTRRYIEILATSSTWY